jgi:AraC family transcriptional activator of pobA
MSSGLVPSSAGDALQLWLLDSSPDGRADASLRLYGPRAPDRRPAAGGGWAVVFMPDALAPASEASDRSPPPGSGRWLAQLRQVGGLEAGLSQADRSTLAGSVWLLRSELARRAPGYALAARSALSLLLVDATRALRLDRTPLPALVADVLDEIEVRYAEPLTVHDLAAAVGQAPIAMARALRRLTGLGPLRLVEERRMVEARRLLLGSDNKIEVIGHLVGYRDAGYFRRRFMRHHTVTPVTWRALNR